MGAEDDIPAPRTKASSLCGTRAPAMHGTLARLPTALLLLLLDVATAAMLMDTSVSCDQNNFILLLNFDSPFEGIIYSEEGFPNCVYVNGTIQSQTNYQIKVPLSGCQTKMNSEGNLENAIIIQDNHAYLQNTDKKYLLTCIPAAAMAKDHMITVNFGGVTIDNSRTTTEIIKAAGVPAASNVKYSVEILEGHLLDAPRLTTPLNVGDRISYIVRLEKPSPPSQIGRCWASDSKSNLELSDERGCSLQPKGNIWNQFDVIDGAKEVIFINRIKAWAFPTSNEVNIFCNLRMCVSETCSMSHDCEKPAPKRARRFKEHQQTDMKEIETIKAQIRIRRDVVPAVKTTELITTEALSSESTCFSLTHVLLLSGAITVLFMATLLTVVYLFSRPFFRKSRS
uniref:ZP domain-containing protein n=1 Tax=Steinernema glaseri TaxID=37863 RepID=A0A1I8AAT3_9BILA